MIGVERERWRPPCVDAPCTLRDVPFFIFSLDMFSRSVFSSSRLLAVSLSLSMDVSVCAKTHIQGACLRVNGENEIEEHRVG